MLTLLSIIVPLKNEEHNIPLLFEALETSTKPLTNYTFEYIFVDDGSTDASADTIRALAKQHAHIQLVQLARNFGKEIATTAGLHKANGQAAIMIDADLQHPPSLIPKFLERWEAGDDVVIGVREPDAKHAGFVKRLTARWFYRLINRISSVKLTPHATDFRLLDRAVIDEFNRFTEHNRITRGLIDWLGYTRSYIEFTPARRLHGDRSYGYRQLIRLAANSVVSLSFFPLRIAGYLGAFIVLVSTPLILFIMGNHLFFGNSLRFTGSATLAAMILFLIGIVLICQGLMALYIATIYGEVQNRPLYIEKRPRSPQK